MVTSGELTYYYDGGEGSKFESFLARTDCKVVAARHLAGMVRRATSDRPVSVLDIGGGDGSLSAALIRQLHRLAPTAGKKLASIEALDLVEPSGRMRMRAQRRLLGVCLATGVQFRVLDGRLAGRQLLCEGRVRGEGYDLVVCSFILHWLSDVRVGLATAFSYVKPGGMLAVLTFSTSGNDVRKAIVEAADGDPLELEDAQVGRRALGWLGRQIRETRLSYHIAVDGEGLGGGEDRNVVEFITRRRFGELSQSQCAEVARAIRLGAPNGVLECWQSVLSVRNDAVLSMDRQLPGVGPRRKERLGESL